MVPDCLKERRAMVGGPIASLLLLFFDPKPCRHKSLRFRSLGTSLSPFYADGEVRIGRFVCPIEGASGRAGARR